MTLSNLISDRAKKIEVSGIRKVFDLARSLKDPVNLSIGQPHFDVPEAIKAAAKDAIDKNRNGYTVTQGIPELRERLKADLVERYAKPDRDLLVTSGTSGGLLLAMLAVVNPGDEVIVPDPYFVSYPNLIALCGGTMVTVDTAPDFRIDPSKIAAAITPRTKVILFCSPSNPTGVVADTAAMKAVAELARDRGVLLISDEIYRAFHFDGPADTPAFHDENVLVVEGFGKTYGITGWRLGWVHGPKALVEEMTKLQQLTFVCAPSIVQWGGLAAMDYNVSGIVEDYRRKRELVCESLDSNFVFNKPGGAFYLYPKAPWGTGTAFVTAAIQQNLLIIPGSSFSKADTHFRISYAASDDTLRRGCEILNRLAAAGPGK